MNSLTLSWKSFLKTIEIGLTNAMFVPLVPEKLLPGSDQSYGKFLWDSRYGWLSVEELLFVIVSLLQHHVSIDEFHFTSLIQISPHFINTLFTLSGHFGNELIKTVMRRHIFCLPLPVLVYPQLKGMHIKLRFVCLFVYFGHLQRTNRFINKKHGWSWGDNRVIIRCFPH